jgi:hypothetical protein
VGIATAYVAHLLTHIYLPPPPPAHTRTPRLRTTVWIYWIGPLAGACAAALFYRIVYSDDFIPKTASDSAASGAVANGQALDEFELRNDYGATPSPEVDERPPWEGDDDVGLLVVDGDSRDGGRVFHYE